MVRKSVLAALAASALVACLGCCCCQAFVPGAVRALRGDAALVAAGTAAALASAPEAAEAFVYKGKEYFDITYGIPVWAWVATGAGILVYGAALKNAALKYNKPFGTNTVADP